jgi:hypothetical protein
MAQTPVLSVPRPEDSLAFLALPVSGDDGVPQAFLLNIGGVVYRLILGVTFSDPSLVLSSAYAGAFFDLPDPDDGLFLTLRVEREDLPPQTRFLGVSRVTLGSPITIGPLCFQFSRIKLAQANLSGPGVYGSEIVAEVAVADA